MANLGLFAPNRAVAGLAISGGSWEAALPASHLLNAELAVVARTTNASTSSTQVAIDLGQARVIRAVAIVRHNLSLNATWRVLLGTTSGAGDVYSGTLAAWSSSAFQTALATAGVDTGESERDGSLAMIVLPQSYSARHVKVEISDASNADGYVEIGRLFIGGGVVPQYNASYGLRDELIDLSTVTRSESGAPWPVRRRRLRQVRFVLPWLSLDEGELLQEVRRLIGITDEVLYAPDVGDSFVCNRFGMLGQLEEMSALEFPYQRLRALPLVIRQKA
jgi:hypothetical protein